MTRIGLMSEPRMTRIDLRSEASKVCYESGRGKQILFPRAGAATVTLVRVTPDHPGPATVIGDGPPASPACIVLVAGVTSFRQQACIVLVAGVTSFRQQRYRRKR